MSEKTESEEFEDDEDDASAIESDDGDIEFLISDLSKQKRNSAPPGEPAWRKLEKYREQKHTAELLSDFDDYDIGEIEDKAS